VIAFIQKDAQRSLPIGFNSQHDLLIAYTTATQVDKFDIGRVTNRGSSEFPADIKGFHTDSIKALLSLTEPTPAFTPEQWI
jgi:hypothetical protein